MSFRVYATCDIGREALDRLRERGFELEVYDHIEPPPQKVILDKVRSGIDALITTLRDRIDEEVFAAGAAAGLKIVAQLAVGFDNIDRAAANRHKVPFSHTADVLTEATAEFAFFIMGCVARKTWPAEQMVRNQEWSTWHPHQPWLGDEVTGKTLAVIGTGRIGKSVAKKAVGFDMDLLCYDPVYQDQKFVAGIRRVMEVRHREGLCPRLQAVEYVSFEQALGRADFVSLHVPLTRPGEGPEPTHHLMDERRLRLMKPTAYLINTSRGPIVDENALAKALHEGWIAGAALDVFEKEPLPADSPLRDDRLKLKLRLFPHFASAGRATRLSPDPNVGMAGRTVQAVIDVLEKRYDGDPKKMPYIVNKEAF
ncbi:MAG TPA: D-glycerate dehydrogenase [Vicinamibacteria bacterium]|nr:D-glycerate dehydrogenase [Vicinamibacteria bacterium]